MRASRPPTAWAAMSFHPYQALTGAVVIPALVFLVPLHVAMLGVVPGRSATPPTRDERICLASINQQMCCANRQCGWNGGRASSPHPRRRIGGLVY